MLKNQTVLTLYCYHGGKLYPMRNVPLYHDHAMTLGKEPAVIAMAKQYSEMYFGRPARVRLRRAINMTVAGFQSPWTLRALQLKLGNRVRYIGCVKGYFWYTPRGHSS